MCAVGIFSVTSCAVIQGFCVINTKANPVDTHCAVRGQIPKSKRAKLYKTILSFTTLFIDLSLTRLSS